MKTIIILLLFFISLTFCSEYKSLGKIKLGYVAFLNIDSYNNKSDPLLFASTFDPIPLTEDSIYYFPDIKRDVLNFNSTNPKTLGQDLTWPNEVRSIKDDVFGFHASSEAGGFLVPGKSTGAINIFDMRSNPPKPNQVTKDIEEWFYHRIRWFDVDGDGLKDIISSRAIKPIIIGDAKGVLVWLKNPGKDEAWSKKWKETEIIEGPDIFFELRDLDGDGTPEIIAAQFFTQKVVLYWTEDNWSNSSSIKSVVIDDSVGPPFDLEFFDINNDGKIDMLLTNHEGNGTKGAVFCYDIPKEYKTESWERRILTKGFVIRESGVNQAVPGGAKAFWPSTKQVNQKPWILLSGDGSQESYLLTPTSEDPQNYDYNRTVIDDYDATVGQIAVGDVDGDGYTEFFIPSYDDGYIYGYTFKP